MYQMTKTLSKHILSTKEYLQLFLNYKGYRQIKKKIVFKKEGWEEREGRKKREREKGRKKRERERGRKSVAPSALARLSFMLMSTSPQRQVVGKYCGSL